MDETKMKQHHNGTKIRIRTSEGMGGGVGTRDALISEQRYENQHFTGTKSPPAFANTPPFTTFCSAPELGL